MMTEDYVSFETAKLLKEKGFNYLCMQYIIEDDIDKQLVFSEAAIDWNDSPITKIVSIPTLQMAMKWLREKYDLHIIAYPFKTDNPTSVKHYCCKVYKTFNLLGCEKYVNETLSSYEQAVEVAIKYCLINYVK